MKVLFFIALLSLIIEYSFQQQCSNDIMDGTISIQEGSMTKNYFVAQSGGNKNGVPVVTVSNTSMKVPNGVRVYLADKCDTAFTPTTAKRFPLLGKTLGFTIDLSQAGCGCNMAFYLTYMPAYDSSQNPDPTKCGDYYCDANQVCGIYCPEIDIMEANNRALQVTPHKCDAPNGKYYPSCDRGGCGVNTKHSSGVYGPGETIDTNQPFQLEVSFMSSDNTTFTKMETVLKQGSKSHTIVNNCASDYFQSLSEPLKNGMAIIVSYWASTDMGWLDSPPCNSENCNLSSMTTLSDIFIR